MSMRWVNNSLTEPENASFPNRKRSHAVGVATRQNIVVVSRHAQRRERSWPSSLKAQKLSVEVNKTQRWCAPSEIAKPLGMRLTQNRLLPWLDLTLQIRQRGNCQADPSSVVRDSSHDHRKRGGTTNDIDEREKTVNSSVEARVQSIESDPVMGIEHGLRLISSDFSRGLMLRVDHCEPSVVVPAAALDSELVGLGFVFALRPWSVPCDQFDGVGAVILSQVDLAAIGFYQ